jgi:hypothetical protein
MAAPPTDLMSLTAIGILLTLLYRQRKVVAG